MKPTIGRIVHFVSRGSADGIYPKRHVPMIVVDVEGEFVPGESGNISVSGWTFNPGGTRYESFVKEDQSAEVGGTWHWPERED